MIIISIKEQKLYLYNAQHALIVTYPISSSKYGIGQTENTNKTPLGLHRISQKIGADAAINSVFIGRKFTGEIYSEQLAQENPHRDWILSRILRLSGMEVGFNIEGKVDTFKRYIYIHGCPDSASFERPGSIGCIRMRNNDIIKLAAAVDENDLVYITYFALSKELALPV
jgi:lipoprotein-anchoring transpeptidase ErfK/SrfK